MGKMVGRGERYLREKAVQWLWTKKKVFLKNVIFICTVPIDAGVYSLRIIRETTGFISRSSFYQPAVATAVICDVSNKLKIRGNCFFFIPPSLHFNSSFPTLFEWNLIWMLVFWLYKLTKREQRPPWFDLLNTSWYNTVCHSLARRSG